MGLIGVGRAVARRADNGNDIVEGNGCGTESKDGLTRTGRTRGKRRAGECYGGKGVSFAAIEWGLPSPDHRLFLSSDAERIWTLQHWTIRLLLPLINEIQEYNVPLVGGAITSFEGLEHAVFKAKGLVMRCGGQSSRLYMVLRKEKFAEKFKLMTLEIESQVNSLPLGALQPTDTTQQQVFNCIAGLRSMMYDVEGEENVLLDTKVTLADLKEGVKVSHDRLEGLAKRFCLTLNQDVLREAALLEKERELARTEKDKHEEDYINQLLVLVTKIGDDLAEQKQAQVEFGGIPVPADFRCPLSLELMSDPVIVASGQTYERGYIQQWLDQGNTTCPKTRQTLNHTNLIPNYTVKALIASWCEVNNVPFPEPVKLNSSTTGIVASFPAMPFKRASSALAERRLRDVTSLPILREDHMPHMKFFEDLSPSPGQSYRDTEALQHLTLHSPRPGLNGDANMVFSPSISRKSSFNGDSANSRAHSRNTSSSSVASSADDTLYNAAFDENSAETAHHQPNEVPLQVHAMQRRPVFGSNNHGSSLAIASLNRLTLSSSRRLRGSDLSVPSRNSSPAATDVAENNMRMNIMGLVGDLKSGSEDAQRAAAASLRLLAKHSPDNRKFIANCGAIAPLVMLLDSPDSQTQENVVTALLNLSIDDNNKNEIAAAGAIDPLVKVLRTGTAEARENSAATLFSLSVMDENKVAVGQSGAIPPLVDLLMHGSPRGKKDAATALFNLSILHENKARIVGAGAVRPLVDLMADPAAGMVDKAVAVLANLATNSEGRSSIGEEGGIPSLVEVVELGSQSGKENAASALLHLCTNNHRFRAMVLQEGAIPPLVALSQSGTARAKEKALALLRHFREQRQAVLGRGMRERNMDQRQRPYV
ncbi:hypothetical protein GOP47_0009552 [Adiantum capillus-veneris]|uniref:RING-type E3 ubiquitin transferase n=1 Tax=Adiantum capillus-veneris TaxID=13818 RepID=A0A9D4ZJL8_ADICA|nr:hypothetical protein GOP47_0009552 [Adiantum capillus-veneris]